MPIGRRIVEGFRATNGFPGLLPRYLPLLAVLSGFSLFVALVPSAPLGTHGFLTPGQDWDDDEELVLSEDGSAGGRAGSEITRAGPGSGMSSGRPGGTEGQGARGPWTPTGEDCSRRQVINTPGCRPVPAFWGDNGGATYMNVTQDEVRIVVYEPGRNEQVAAILEAGGARTDDQSRDLLEAYQIYFNRVFETYGRRVRIIFERGQAADNDAAAQAADGRRLVQELKASFVVSLAGSRALHDELARLRVPSMTLSLQFTKEYYDRRAPFMWGIFPDIDLTLDHVAEYWCKRLRGREAVHAGTPDLRNRPRELGILYPADHEILRDAGPLLKKKVEACGGEVKHIVGFPGGVGQAQQTATNAIAQMRDADVNTITCTCGLIALVFLTNAATQQGYFPEWLHNGVFLSDAIGAQRLYNQQQWERAFGPSVLGYYTPLAKDPSYRAYFQGKPHGDHETATKGSGYYTTLMFVFSGIEAAGPNLNPASFGRALFDLPAIGGQGNQTHLGFDRNSPSPFTAIKDMMEIWWNPRDADTPDGESGWVWYVNAGRRYVAGDWPSSDPVVFRDDGSPQPGRDPDA